MISILRFFIFSLIISNAKADFMVFNTYCEYQDLKNSSLANDVIDSMELASLYVCYYSPKKAIISTRVLSKVILKNNLCFYKLYHIENNSKLALTYLGTSISMLVDGDCPTFGSTSYILMDEEKYGNKTTKLFYALNDLPD